MAALLLCGVLCCSLGADDQLIQQLDVDYQALLEQEKYPQAMRDAEQAMVDSEQSSQWTRYMEGLKIIRRTRSKAAIPLLLKYLVRHANRGWQPDEYAATLTVLTGKSITEPENGPNRERATHDYVDRLVKQWWTPKKATITTDLSKMSQEELATVTGQLLAKAEKSESMRASPGGRQEPTAGLVQQSLAYAVMGENPSYPRSWQKEDLHPAMVPLLLAKAGYEEKPPEKPEKPGCISYATVPMLASLRKNGQAPALDKLADDARQTSATRLTCALALYAAGERLKTPVLLEVLDREKDFELRLVAITELRESREKRLAGDKLVALLDDANSEIRTAAIPR